MPYYSNYYLVHHRFPSISFLMVIIQENKSNSERSLPLTELQAYYSPTPATIYHVQTPPAASTAVDTSPSTQKSITSGAAAKNGLCNAAV